MATQQAMVFCKTCNKTTLHIQPSTSHVLHLLLAVVTMGIWIPIWVLMAVNNNNQGQCTACGRSRGVFGT